MRLPSASIVTYPFARPSIRSHGYSSQKGHTSTPFSGAHFLILQNGGPQVSSRQLHRNSDFTSPSRKRQNCSKSGMLGPQYSIESFRRVSCSVPACFGIRLHIEHSPQYNPQYVTLFRSVISISFQRGIQRTRQRSAEMTG